MSYSIPLSGTRERWELRHGLRKTKRRKVTLRDKRKDATK